VEFILQEVEHVEKHTYIHIYIHTYIYYVHAQTRGFDPARSQELRGRGCGHTYIHTYIHTYTMFMHRQAELILQEVKNFEGVDVDIKLEGLGGNRRRISGGLYIEAPPRAIWDTLTNYNQLNQYIPNIAESGAQLQVSCVRVCMYVCAHTYLSTHRRITTS
jgi:hypothetical protein